MPNLSHNENRLLGAIVVLLFLAAITFIGAQKKSMALQSAYNEERKNQQALATFLNTDDDAKSVYVYDATKKKVLYERNADTSLPLASLVKLATALAATENVDPTKKITITDSAIEASGDNGLNVGEAWRLDQLVGLMLVVSSNDAAFAIKNAYEKDGQNFIEAMNAYGKKIGLEHTTFYNPAGLDSGSRPGGVGSAKDVSTLLLAFLEKMPEAASFTVLPQKSFNDASGKGHLVSNTNDLSTRTDTLLASKTGYTALAGGNLAIAYRMPVYGDTIVIVVLGSTREGRFVDIERYMQGVENYFKISRN